MLRQMLVCYESILTAESSAFLFRNGCRVSGNWGTSRLSPYFPSVPAFSRIFPAFFQVSLWPLSRPESVNSSHISSQPLRR